MDRCKGGGERGKGKDEMVRQRSGSHLSHLMGKKETILSDYNGVR